MKIGVLGLGSIGFRHAKNLRDMGHEVVGYDPAVPSLSATTTREFVIDESDAVVIATPTEQHYDDLMDCLACFNKPVFVEKPLVATKEQLKALEEYHELDHVMVGNNLRFRRCVQEAHPVVRDARCAMFTLSQRNDKPGYLRDGVTLNWGAHEIDLALHFFGPGKVDVASINADDTIADIVIQHYSGCRSNIHLDYISKAFMRGVMIVGKDWNIEVAIEGNVLMTDLGPRHWEASFDGDYLDEIAAFTRCVEGKARWTGATGEDAAAACELIFDAKEKARK